MFDWDEANLEHIAQHGVAAPEVEQALTDPERVPAPAYRKSGERRRAVFGATEAGRLLMVIFTGR